MKKAATIFLLAVFIPSLVLGYLALRSLRDQRIIIERQAVTTYQGITDSLAVDLNNRMLDVQDEFQETVNRLLADGQAPDELAASFHQRIREEMKTVAVGFALNAEGDLISPTAADSAQAQVFIQSNSGFLRGDQPTEIFSNALFIRGFDSLADEEERDSRSEMISSREEAPSPLGRRAEVTSQESEVSSVAMESQEHDSFAAGLEDKSQMGGESKIARSVAENFTDERPASPTATTMPSSVPVRRSSAENEAMPQAEDSLQEVVQAERAAEPELARENDYLGKSKDINRKSKEEQWRSTPQVYNRSATKQTIIERNLNVQNQFEQAQPPRESLDQSEADVDEQYLRGEWQGRLLQPSQLPIELNGAAPPKMQSALQVVRAEFTELARNAREGSLARMRGERLYVMMWSRPRYTGAAEYVFGAEIDLEELTREFASLLSVPKSMQDDICLALVNHRGEPVTQTGTDHEGDWKLPFVATEIGEILPFWEAAIYLSDPGSLERTARASYLTAAALIGFLITSISLGGMVVYAYARRAIRVVRQKTDFVSNVSHELKTPLTSIRMFSELLHEGRVKDEGRQKDYLSIIMSESSRLTRLINNVLDFARLERGEKDYELAAVNLVSVVRETAEMHEPSLEKSGLQLQLDLPEEDELGEKYIVKGDRDALSQVLVNLLSNCEKYASEGKEIQITLSEDKRTPETVRLCVLDRGPGIPRGMEKRIFEQFFRANNSLTCAQRGTGLGLTLAAQIINAHEGRIYYEPREGGGSRFCVELPRRAGEE